MPKPVTRAYGILNRYGDFWTPRTFASTVEAEIYMGQFLSRLPCDLSAHKIIPVIITPLSSSREGSAGLEKPHEELDEVDYQPDHPIQEKRDN
jgi:hypothetical protein